MRQSAQRIEKSDRNSTPWLDVRGAAAWALVSEGTVVREARAGRLRGYKVGNRKLWRFRRQDVDGWLMRHETPTEYEPNPSVERTR